MRFLTPRGARTAAVTAVGLLLLGAATAAAAQSPESQLAAAEASAAEAESTIAQASADQAKARAALAKVAPKTAQANEAAAAALAKVESIEADIINQREAAADADSEPSSSQEEYDDELSTGISFAIGSALLALAILFWSQIKASPPVRWLAQLNIWKAVAATVGVGFAVCLLGGGFVGASAIALKVLGGVLIVFGLALPIILLVARHQVRAEQNLASSSEPREERRWGRILAAVVLLLLFVIGLTGALSAEEPPSDELTAEQQELAEQAEGDVLDPPTDELVAARAAAEPLQARATELEQARQEAEAALTKATTKLRQGRRQLARAQSTIASASRRLARQQAAAAPPPSSGGGGGSSSPSYTSCDSAPSNIAVPPGSDLDADGDGIGCEE
jgi:hypothetical protein